MEDVRRMAEWKDGEDTNFHHVFSRRDRQVEGKKW
jgi:hypothetical protein